MKKEQALEIILQVLNDLNEELDAAERIEVTPDVRLFGSDSVIDSLSLVSIIVDVENEVSEAQGTMVTLSDDEAVAREPSPFTTPNALADYIAEITA